MTFSFSPFFHFACLEGRGWQSTEHRHRASMTFSFFSFAVSSVEDGRAQSIDTARQSWHFSVVSCRFLIHFPPPVQGAFQVVGFRFCFYFFIYFFCRGHFSMVGFSFCPSSFLAYPGNKKFSIIIVVVSLLLVLIHCCPCPHAHNSHTNTHTHTHTHTHTQRTPSCSLPAGVESVRGKCSFKNKFPYIVKTKSPT